MHSSGRPVITYSSELYFYRMLIPQVSGGSVALCQKLDESSCLLQTVYSVSKMTNLCTPLRLQFTNLVLSTNLY